MNKSKIRKRLLKIRMQNNSKKLSIDVKYLSNILQKNKSIGKTIGAYYPYNYEIDVIKILERFEKKNYKISLPKIRKNFQMDFFHWSTKDALEINKFGIPEPTSNKVVYPSFLLVPLLAFDKNLNRVGYGGGFYDRYIRRLKKNKKILTIGLAYSYQQLKKVPTNKYDIKLDFIVTDKKIK